MSSITGILPTSFLPSATGSGLAAIAAGNQQLSQDAAQIAGQIASPDSGDSIASLVDLSQAKVLAEVGAAVLRTSDQMLGSLLDTYA